MGLRLIEQPLSQDMNEPEKLIPLHGGYRKLKSFQVAQPACDVTVRFVDQEMCQTWMD
jgi:hypothetical protein